LKLPVFDPVKGRGRVASFYAALRPQPSTAATKIAGQTELRLRIDRHEVCPGKSRKQKLGKQKLGTRETKVES
jgi:hypothetical protein